MPLQGSPSCGSFAGHVLQFQPLGPKQLHCVEPYTQTVGPMPPLHIDPSCGSCAGHGLQFQPCPKQVHCVPL